MKVSIEIKMNNAAFEENPAELSRILRKLANDLDDPSEPDGYIQMDGSLSLRDINGNRVGFCEFDEEEEG